MIDLTTALAKIASELVMVGKDRTGRGEPVEFVDLRDAMLSVHCAIQSFIKMVRDKREVNAVSVTSLQLAAVLTKLVVDLSKTNHKPQIEIKKKSNIFETLLGGGEEMTEDELDV